MTGDSLSITELTPIFGNIQSELCWCSVQSMYRILNDSVKTWVCLSNIHN